MKIVWETPDIYQVRVIAIWVSIVASIKVHANHSWLSEEPLWKKTYKIKNAACLLKGDKLGLKLWLRYTVRRKKQRREQLQLEITMWMTQMFSVPAQLPQKLLKRIEARLSKRFCRSRVKPTNVTINLLSTTIGLIQDKQTLLIQIQ